MSLTLNEEESAIGDWISLRHAGRRLGRDPKLIKGAALAMGIRLVPVARSLVMGREDFLRLEARLGRAPVKQSS